MDIISIIVISVGLAMDSMAVCVSQSMCRKSFVLQRSIKIAFVFAFFQAFMPFLGYLSGWGFSKLIERVDHWFAFVILAMIGAKMIYESLFKKEENCECICNSDNSDAQLNSDNSDAQLTEKAEAAIDWKKVVALSFATSIDALVAGLIFVPYPESLPTAVTAIGLVCFLLSLTGMYIGTYFGRRIKIDISLFGGVILIAIGAKILIEHLS